MLVVILLLLAAAAAFAVLASEMPRAAAWPLALAALAWGAWRARHEARRRPCEIVIISGNGQSTADSRAIEALVVHWRGPLAFLHWRDQDGHIQRRVFFPDTLSAARRRELRLAAPRPVSAHGAASMAP